MDILGTLLRMQEIGWSWHLRGTEMKNAKIVITARKSPYGRMYGYGRTESEAWRMFSNMISNRVEELVENGIFCRRCRGKGWHRLEVGSNKKYTCPDCGGDGKGEVQRERDNYAKEKKNEQKK
jgi:RecJ-like exonuclease